MSMQSSKTKGAVPSINNETPNSAPIPIHNAANIRKIDMKRKQIHISGMIGEGRGKIDDRDYRRIGGNGTTIEGIGGEIRDGNGNEHLGRGWAGWDGMTRC